MKPTAARNEKLSRHLARLVTDERGGEVIEWALVAGLVVIAAIAAIGAIGTKVLARWTTVNDAPL